MKYELFGPCADAISGDEPPTFHSQCHGMLGKPPEALFCSCSCHPWADKAKETTNDD